MKISEILHTPITVPGNTLVSEAARVMEKHHIDSVLVEHKNKIGICTERDILRKVVARDLEPAHLKVADVMSHPLHTIDINDNIDAASFLMEKNDIRRLVVTDSGKIVGIVTASCIARNVKYFTARRMMEGYNKEI